MKIFTVEEANRLLPELIPKLERIQHFYRTVESLRETVKSAAAAAELGGGGMPDGARYVNSLYEVGKLTSDLTSTGVQLKDYSRGLIDFPTMRGGNLVLLCWKLGEEPAIAWWHETEAGFAGRKPL